MNESSMPSAPPVAKAGRRRIIAVIVIAIVAIAVIAGGIVYVLSQSPTPGTIKIGFTISRTGSLQVEGTNSILIVPGVGDWLST